MAWDKNCVLAIGANDAGVRKLATAMAARYRVGKDSCFSYMFPFDGFPATSKNCLKTDAATKLMICGHGEKQGLISGQKEYDYEARHIADILIEMGIKQVGLISFKACNIGKKNFLDDLLANLQAHASVGYLIGYKGGAYLEKGGKMRDFWNRKQSVRIVKGNLHVAVPSAGYLKFEERI